MLSDAGLAFCSRNSWTQFFSEAVRSGYSISANEHVNVAHVYTVDKRFSWHQSREHPFSLSRGACRRIQVRLRLRLRLLALGWLNSPALRLRVRRSLLS